MARWIDNETEEPVPDLLEQVWHRLALLAVAVMVLSMLAAILFR